MSGRTGEREGQHDELEFLQGDDFIERYGPKTPEEVEQVRARLMNEPPFEDGEYEEPDPPARTVEELEAQWTKNGMPAERRATMIAEVKRLGLLDPPPLRVRMSVQTGLAYLRQTFADYPPDAVKELLASWVGERDERALLATCPELAKVVEAVDRVAHGEPLAKFPDLTRAVRDLATARTTQERVSASKQTNGLPQARSFASICAEADEATDWLLSGYLAREYVTLLYAKPKVGKSELTYNLIAASQQGGEFLGQRIRPLRVVYLSEEPPRSIRQKVDRLGIDASRIVGLCRKDTIRRQFDFASVLRWAKVAAKADSATKQPKADLIVIDTLAFWAKLPPEAENDAGTMAEVGNQLADLAAETGCAVLVLMHSKKGNEAGIDAMRGSSAMAGASDILVQLRQPHDGLPERELRVQGRDDEIAKPVKVTFREGKYALVGSLLPHGKSTKKRLIVNAVPTKGSTDGWRVDRIAKETGLSERYVRELVAELVEEKVFVKEDVREKRRTVPVYWRSPEAAVFYDPGEGETA